MELRHLRYFVAVAEAGSLTNAAERRLHTAQPSLSRQIRALELEIGVTLLERKARGIALTAAGRVFLEHARLALMQIEVACEAARGTERPKKLGFVIGFLLGQEAIWLSESLRILREEAVVARPLRGEVPTIDLMMGCNKSNASPLLKRFLLRAEELVNRVSQGGAYSGRLNRGDRKLSV